MAKSTKFENQERWRLLALQVVMLIFSARYPLAASGYTIQRKTKSQSLVQKTAMIFTVFMMTKDVRAKCGTVFKPFHRQTLAFFAMEAPQRASPYIIGMFEADFVARKTERPERFDFLALNQGTILNNVSL